MSSGLTSSWCAAMRRAFSTRRSPAILMAWPPTASEREPYVSMPYGARPVSPWTTSMSSKGTPITSLAIWLQAVSWPWPCGDVPVISSTLPVGRTRMVQCSQPPATYFSAPSVRDGARPHISVNVEMPMPSCTGSPDARRACCSARRAS